MFALFLTDAGYVYSSGYAEYGVLGNGVTGRLATGALLSQAKTLGERIVKGNKRAFDIETPPRRYYDLGIDLTC
jgi:hypothetical protein